MRCDFFLLLYLTAKNYYELQIYSRDEVQTELLSRAMEGKSMEEIASLVLHPLEKRVKEQILPTYME